MDASWLYTAYDWIRQLDDIAKQSPWYHWWLFDVWRLIVALMIYAWLGLLALTALSFFVYYIVFLPVHVVRTLPKLLRYLLSLGLKRFASRVDQEADDFSQREHFSQHHRETAQFDANSGWDPREILGVGSSSSREEITAAYREKMKQNHPDRLAHLDPQIQKFATHRTQEINKAYQQLLRASG